MDLFKTIKTIEGLAAKQPPVASICRNDIYLLNAAKDVRYGVFAWTQGAHRVSADGATLRLAFYLYYVDRLTDGGSNTLEVQSVGVEVLRNILAGMTERGIGNDGAVIRTFTERFADECAGAYAEVTFDVPAAFICEDVEQSEATAVEYITASNGKNEII